MPGPVVVLANTSDETSDPMECLAPPQPPVGTQRPTQPEFLWWFLATLSGGGLRWQQYDHASQLLLEGAYIGGQRGVLYRMSRFWYHVDFKKWEQKRQSRSAHAEPRPVMRLPAIEGQPAYWPATLDDVCVLQ